MSESISLFAAENRQAARISCQLSISQAISTSVNAAAISTFGLIGYVLASRPAFATVPVTFFMLGVALTTYPASSFMRVFGRRTGFITGSIIASMGCLLAAYAISLESFTLFCASAVLIGVNMGFAGFLRFAAADSSSATFRPRAISVVLIGGIAAAFMAVYFVQLGTDLLDGARFAGVYVVLAGLLIINVLVLTQLRMPKVQHHEQLPARPLGKIMNRKVIVAILCSMIAYSLMNLVMTAAPIAMVKHYNHTEVDSHLGIQWHVIAMYAPSLITGQVIARLGRELTIVLGLVLTALCGVIALWGVEVMHFWWALIMLGVGWNFSFTGATTLLADTYQPSEKNMVQGINDLFTFGLVTIASTASAVLLEFFGWSGVNMLIFPFVAIAFALIVWLYLSSLQRADSSKV